MVSRRAVSCARSCVGQFSRAAQRDSHALRVFSSTASTSAATELDTHVTPRAQIPPEIRKPTKAPAAPAEPTPTPTEDEPEAVSAEQDDSAARPPLTHQELSLLFSFTTPPPISALSALAHRLALSTTAAAPSHSLAEHLPLLEQCLIHESFWAGVAHLPPTSVTHRYTNFHDDSLAASPTATQAHAHNGPLATLGNALLGTLTSELIMTSFPNLPTRAAKAALTMYAGPKSLAAVAASWGVSPTRLDLRDVGREEQRRMSRKEKAYGHLVGGVGGARKKDTAIEGAAGAGLVRWNRRPTTPVKDAVLYEDALASVARAVVGAIYQVHGLAAARAFVHAHVTPRLLASPSSTQASSLAASDIIPLLKFTNPTKVLTDTLMRHGRPASVHRLLKESGRLSAHPTFVSGVFSGDVKLGEGFGSSIKMSEWRASEDALRRLYIGGGLAPKRLPSDTWIDGQAEFDGIRLGDVEVDHESR